MQRMIQHIVLSKLTLSVCSFRYHVNWFKQIDVDGGVVVVLCHVTSGGLVCNAG